MGIGGFVCTNYWAQITMHFFHDNKLVDIKVINNSSNQHDQPLLNFDYSGNNDMQYTGSKSQTFYNDSIIRCKFDGYLNAAAVIVMGSNWGSTAETNRSVNLDSYFYADTIQNVSRTGGGNVGAISGTGFNCKMDMMFFSNIDGPGSANASHNESVAWYGTIMFLRGRQSNCYASMLRNHPLAWNGVSGAYRNGFSAYAGNVVDHQRSYTPQEWATSNVGNRTTSNGFFPCKTYTVYNSTFNTVEASYNPPGHYFGFAGCDNENTDSIHANYNAGSRIERDYALFHSTWDSAGRGFVVANIGSPATHQETIGNRVFLPYSTKLFIDTVAFMPGDTLKLSTPGTYYSWFDHDLYGNAIPTSGALYAGAVQPVSASSPPSCTTNASPLNGTTISTQTTANLSWNVAAGATGYKIYVYVNGGSLPGSPSYTTPATSVAITGLTPGLTYRFYVVPYNAFGDAVSCGIAYTTFTTAPQVFDYIRILRR